MAGPQPSPLNNYDPNQVYCYFNNILVTGFEVGTLIKVSRTKDSFTYKSDISGTGTRTKTNDYSGTIEWTLTQKSGSNEFLSTVAIIDEQTGGGTGVLMIKDSLGADLVICQSCWIMKMPDIEFHAESGVRVWRLQSDKIVWNLGN